MSADPPAFLSLIPERRAIRIANGKVLHSEGLGPIRFLSNSGFYITINDVLFVPSLASNLFASNRFAREHREDYIKVLEFPLRLH